MHESVKLIILWWIQVVKLKISCWFEWQKIASWQTKISRDSEYRIDWNCKDKDILDLVADPREAHHAGARPTERTRDAPHGDQLQAQAHVSRWDRR